MLPRSAYLFCATLSLTLGFFWLGAGLLCAALTGSDPTIVLLVTLPLCPLGGYATYVITCAIYLR